MSSGRQAPIVELRNVGWWSPSHPEHRALQAVDLTIRSGDRIGVVGRSGSGKTTLALILAGLLEPAEGTVTRAAPAGRLAVGVVFQEAEASFFEETVLEDVAFGPRNLGLPDPLERARAALARVGLDPDRVGGQAPETLSGGEARRAAIASILAADPAFVVFDEPTTGLDAEGVARLRTILAGLRDECRGYVLISHELELVVAETERVVVLHHGRPHWEGPSRSLGSGLPEPWPRADLGFREVSDAALAQGWLDDPSPTPRAVAAAIAPRLIR